jgi:hypothetical protein
MSTSGSETRRLTSALFVRLDPALRAFVDAAAASTSTNGATWIRDLITDRQGNDARAQPRPAMRRRPSSTRSPDDIAALARLAAYVARLNGAVVQLAKSVRLTGSAVEHAELECVLADLRAAQRQLVAAIERQS